MIKAAVGFWTGSLAVLSSAFDSLLDIASSTINFFAVRLAEQPPDEKHPYGHSKFEPLAAQIQSFLILFSGLYILYRAYHNITEGTVLRETGANIWVMVFSIAVTAVLVVFLKYVAKREKSSVIEADCLHYQIDLLTGGGILFALIIIKITGIFLIDAIVSAVIAVYIIFSALKLNFSVTRELLDEVLPAEEMEVIEEVLKRHDQEIVEVHKLRTRKAGDKRFVDMHLVLWQELSLKTANDLRRDIENRIKKRLNDADVNIYIEPCDGDSCEECRVCEKYGRKNTGSRK